MFKFIDKYSTIIVYGGFTLVLVLAVVQLILE